MAAEPLLDNLYTTGATEQPPYHDASTSQYQQQLTIRNHSLNGPHFFSQPTTGSSTYMQHGAGTGPGLRNDNNLGQNKFLKIAERGSSPEHRRVRADHSRLRYISQMLMEDIDDAACQREAALQAMEKSFCDILGQAYPRLLLTALHRIAMNHMPKVTAVIRIVTTGSMALPSVIAGLFLCQTGP